MVKDFICYKEKATRIWTPDDLSCLIRANQNGLFAPFLQPDATLNRNSPVATGRGKEIGQDW